MNEVGGKTISDVTTVEHEFKFVRQLPDGRTAAFEQWTWHRTGDEPPPEIDVPGDYRIIAAGRDYGVRRCCCTGRSPEPGGYLYVKAEA